MARPAVLVLVLLVGCAAEPAAAPPSPAQPAIAVGRPLPAQTATAVDRFHVSGSRLRAKVARAGDTSWFEVWHDTRLDVDCQFMRTGDGRQRCVPLRGDDISGTVGQLQYYPEDSLIAYGDASCASAARAYPRACESKGAVFLRYRWRGQGTGT